MSPGYEDGREKERERENAAGGKEMLLVRQREISGI